MNAYRECARWTIVSCLYMYQVLWSRDSPRNEWDVKGAKVLHEQFSAPMPEGTAFVSSPEIFGEYKYGNRAGEAEFVCGGGSKACR